MIGVDAAKWEQFKAELLEQTLKLHIDFGNGMMCFYCASGMPSWAAYIKVLQEYPQSQSIEFDPTKMAPFRLKNIADRLMQSSDMKTLSNWIVERGTELGVYDPERYSWKKADSEDTLRLLLEETMFRIRTGSKTSTDWFTLAKNITGELTSLNRLDKEDGIVTHKVVVFEGADEVKE